VYCPATFGTCVAGTFGNIAGGISPARSAHVAASLTNGFGLILGGRDAGDVPLPSSQRFDPGPSAFGGGAVMGSARSQPAIARLNDGRVLVTGGRTATGPTRSAELYIGPF
jgi:hypothetical protein